MKNIITFAGSDSKASINRQLAVYASSLTKNINITILDLNDYKVPLYGVDFEIENGIPKKAQNFLDIIKETDGIILSLAEHNGTYTTVFKNLFDWMSRIDGKLWSNKPMLLMSTSPGENAAKTGLNIALNRFKYMGGNIVSQFSLPSFNKNFKDEKIIDDTLNNQLKEKVKEFQNSL